MTCTFGEKSKIPDLVQELKTMFLDCDQLLTRRDDTDGTFKSEL